MYQGRDSGIGFIKARLGRSCYGMGLGIIILDDVYPGFPGDVRNASAFPFPIQYEVARGVQSNQLVTEQTAAGSEEMASSSQELGAQATTLRDLVNQFTIQ